MTRFLEVEASRHNDFESLVDIETGVDFNHLMRLQRHAFSIQFMYRYAAACDTPLPEDAGEGLEEPAVDTTHEYVEVPQEDDEWQDASSDDEQYLDACEYRKLPSRESSAGGQPAHYGGSASDFAPSFENLRRSSNGPSQVLLRPASPDDAIRAAAMAMRSNYGNQHRAVDNLRTGYADTQIASPSFRGSPSLAQLMGHPMLADNEAEPSRQFASYPSDHGSANMAQRHRDSAEEEESPSGLSIVSFESEVLTVSSTPRQHPLAHFPYRNQWAATSDPALSPTESMKSSKSDDTNESSASIETTTPMLRRSAPSLSGGPAQYSQMYDNYRAGTLISGARPYNPDLPAFRYADSETDDDSSEESSSSSENETGNEAFQTYGFGSDSLRAVPKLPSQTHPDERYDVKDGFRQPKQMPQILDMPIPDWSVINALANQPPREGMDSFARSWMQNTPAVMAYQAGTPLSPISEEESVEENCANCSYCIKYPHKKCPQKCPSTPSLSASTPQINGYSSASRPSPGRSSFYHSFSRIARLEASTYARTEPIFGGVPATNNRRSSIMGETMGGTGSRTFSTGLSGAPLQRRSTVGSLRRRRGSDGNDSCLRTTFMQGRTPPRLDAHDDDVDAYDEDFFLGDDDANWQIYPDNSSPASAAPFPALGSYQPFSDADRERMASSLQAGMGMLVPDDARRGASKMDLKPPESAYMPGRPNTPQGTRVASLEGFSGSGRSSDSPRSPIVGESLGDYVVNWNQTAKKKSKDSKLSNPSSDGLDEDSPLANKGKDSDKGKGADKPLPASPHPVRTSSLQGNRDKHIKSAEAIVTPERTSSLGATRNEDSKTAEKNVSPDKGKSVLARSAAGMELSPERRIPARGAPYNIFGNTIIPPEIILTPSRRGSSPVRGRIGDNRSPAQCGNNMSPNCFVNLDTNTICKNIADTLSDYSGSYRSLQSSLSMRSNPTPHKLKPKSIPHSRRGLDAESFTPTEDKTTEEQHKLQLKESSGPTKDKSSDKPKKPKLNKPLPVPRLSPNAGDSGTGTPSPSRSPLSFTRIKEKAKTLFMSDKDSKSDTGRKTPDGFANPSPTNDAESAEEGVLLPSPERAGDGAGSKENDKSDTPSKLDRFRKAAEGLGGRRKSFGEKMINAD